MKKMLKIMAMLLIIATVVFAAGCSSNKQATEEKGATEQVTENTAIAEQNTTHAEATINVTEDQSGMPGDNYTEPEGNFTEPGNNTTESEDTEDDMDENITVPEPEVTE